MELKRARAFIEAHLINELGFRASHVELEPKFHMSSSSRLMNLKGPFIYINFT
ncbi:hypothetical protein HanIR_Chr15g0750111 [Helianthus annuus]|nr:hypothetical protein HanIR_Chr15g0750111 [Helianthus annuus]